MACIVDESLNQEVVAKKLLGPLHEKAYICDSVMVETSMIEVCRFLYLQWDGRLH